MAHPVEHRIASIHAAADRLFDVAIVGGGINGAAIAHDAARRGLSVALFEKGDFASGTSSRSSRLIHGGIRYLEYGHLGLVFESSRERRILSRIAPHLVRPLAFTWPVYRGARIPLWKLRAGLIAYDTLSLFANFRRHSGLRRQELLASEPGLARSNLVGGARYFDAATDDARLALANVRAAAAHGATVLNYCEVRGISRAGAETVLSLADVEGGGSEEFSCRARVAVNAAGPWLDEIIKLVQANRAPVVQGTKGVHVAVPRERIGNIAAITIISPDDGRVLFVLPSGSTAIIGTTETNTAESPDEVRASPDDVSYLLHAANHYFPNAQLVPDDVVSAWAGIRPLAATFFRNEPGRASREHELRWEQDMMLTVSGGKLTTYRVVARDVVDALVQKIGRGARVAIVDERLPGSNIESFEAEAAVAQLSVEDAALAGHLVQSYGSEWRDVWSLTQSTPELAHRIHPALPWLRAEIVHAVRAEMAMALSDVLLRRTHLAFETRDNGRGVAEDVALLMASELGWSVDARQAALDAYERDVARVFGATRRQVPSGLS